MDHQETTEKLKQLEQRLQRARSRYDLAREARNEAVREAVAEGVRPADIARATGLTRGRIAQVTR
jgi:hypothetical protein